MVNISLMFLSEWHEFPSTRCLAEKKLVDISCLHIVEIARVVWNVFLKLCNKKRLEIRHMNRPLFLTTLSDPSYVIVK